MPIRAYRPAARAVAPLSPSAHIAAAHPTGRRSQPALTGDAATGNTSGPPQRARRPATEPAAAREPTPAGAAATTAACLYTARTMNLTVTRAQHSSVTLEVELPADRLDRSVSDAVKRLSRRTRVAGFRPGKAPRVMLERVLGPGVVLDEAVEHLVEDAYREAVTDLRILPLASPAVDVVTAEEGRPLVFKATVQVRPDVHLGDYRNFNFAPEIDTIDAARIDKVIEDLREQHAILEPVEGRTAERGDYAVIGFTGTRDGEPFVGGTAERMPLLIGEDRLIPGFEEHLVDLQVGDTTEFDITFPEDYAEASLAGATAHFNVDVKELRAKILPEVNDDFAREMGSFADLTELRDEIRKRLERNATDHARHAFADRIIDYAVANASFRLPPHLNVSGDAPEGLPDVLIDQEIEVMHDEFRSSLARQGITEEAYLRVTGQTTDELHRELRPKAEERVKVLLVVSNIADAEGIAVTDDEVEAEVNRARERYAENPRLVRYFDSERGRKFIRSTARRSHTVDHLIDDWLVAHPEHPPLPHADADDERSVVQTTAVEAAGSIGARDPASFEELDPSGAAEGHAGGVDHQRNHTTRDHSATGTPPEAEGSTPAKAEGSTPAAGRA